MLLQDGGQVALGHVIGKGAVAEHTGGVARGSLLLVPGHDAQGQRLGIGHGDAGVQAGHQHAAADAVNGLAGDAFVLDEGRSTILYDIEFLNDMFLVLKQHGTSRYFVLGDEKFVKKINYDWYNAMEELYNIYRHNSRFSLWVFVLIFIVIMFAAYFYM